MVRYAIKLSIESLFFERYWLFTAAVCAYKIFITWRLPRIRGHIRCRLDKIVHISRDDVFQWNSWPVFHMLIVLYSAVLTLLTKTLAVSKQLFRAAKWSAETPSAILSLTISGFFFNMISAALQRNDEHSGF